MSIFKAYDIRGIYGQDLDEDLFYAIARAYAQFAGVRGGKVVVANPNDMVKGVFEITGLSSVFEIA